MQYPVSILSCLNKKNRNVPENYTERTGSFDLIGFDLHKQWFCSKLSTWCFHWKLCKSNASFQPLILLKILFLFEHDLCKASRQENNFSDEKMSNGFIKPRAPKTFLPEVTHDSFIILAVPFLMYNTYTRAELIQLRGYTHTICLFFLQFQNYVFGLKWMPKYLDTGSTCGYMYDV